MKYSDMLDNGEAVPEISVFECDGEFYVEDGLESALAYAFNMETFVPARLVKGECGERSYIKMKNSL